MHLAKQEELILGDIASILDEDGCHISSEGLIAIIRPNEPGFNFFLGGDIGSSELQILRSSPAAGYNVSIKTTFVDKIATHPFVPVISVVIPLLIFATEIGQTMASGTKRDEHRHYRRKPHRKRFRWLKFMYLLKKLIGRN